MIEYLNWHKKKYPLMTNDDIYKLIYQSCFAGKNSFKTKKEAKLALDAEFAALKPLQQDLYTYISDNYVRINLRTYRKYKFSKKYLFLAFYETARENKATLKDFNETLISLGLAKSDLSLKRHSLIYHENYHPSYRVIDIKYLTQEMKDVQLKNYVLNQKQPLTIAIEGKCASGKSTIIDMLKKDIKFTKIEMDHFFLPANKRTTKRMNEIGGNIDYERFLKVLEKINSKKNGQISYNRYDCEENKYYRVNLTRHDLIILEGVYSYHPLFRQYIDKLVYLDIDDATQNLRLKKRSNYLIYLNTWTVYENIYYDHEKIKFLSDIII